MFKAHAKQYGRDTEELNPDIVEKMAGYLEKFRELEEYYQVMPNGYIADGKPLKKPSLKPTSKRIARKKR